MTSDVRGPFVVDFAKFGGPVYVGRALGKQARSRLGLDRVDAEGLAVVVRIPPTTFSVNSSFFLGLFGPSIRSAGTREEFLRRYTFEMDEERFKESVDASIDRALFENGLLLS